MAAFFNGYDTTTTTQWMGWPRAYYSTNTAPYLTEADRLAQWPYWAAYPDPEPVDAITRARRALAAVRTFPCRMETVTPSRASRAVYRVAPRRTVVARGHVSWVRAGTRRPL